MQGRVAACTIAMLRRHQAQTGSQLCNHRAECEGSIWRGWLISCWRLEGRQQQPRVAPRTLYLLLQFLPASSCWLRGAELCKSVDGPARRGWESQGKPTCVCVVFHSQSVCTQPCAGMCVDICGLVRISRPLRLADDQQAEQSLQTILKQAGPSAGPKPESMACIQAFQIDSAPGLSLKSRVICCPAVAVTSPRKTLPGAISARAQCGSCCSGAKTGWK